MGVYELSAPIEMEYAPADIPGQLREDLEAPETPQTQRTRPTFYNYLRQQGETDEWIERELRPLLTKAGFARSEINAYFARHKLPGEWATPEDKALMNPTASPEVNERLARAEEHYQDIMERMRRNAPDARAGAYDLVTDGLYSSVLGGAVYDSIKNREDAPPHWEGRYAAIRKFHELENRANAPEGRDLLKPREPAPQTGYGHYTRIYQAANRPTELERDLARIEQELANPDPAPEHSGPQAGYGHYARIREARKEKTPVPWRLDLTPLPDIGMTQAERNNLTFEQRFVHSGVSMAADLPIYALGGAFTPAMPMIGAFGLHSGLRAAYSSLNENGRPETFPELLKMFGYTVSETTKGAITGAVGGVFGRVGTGLAENYGFGTLGQVVSGGTLEIGGLTFAGAGLEGRFPHWQEFMDNAFLIAFMKGLGPGLKAVNKGVQQIQPKLWNIYKETGITPNEVARIVEVDQAALQELFSGEEIPSAIREVAEIERVHRVYGEDGTGQSAGKELNLADVYKEGQEIARIDAATVEEIRRLGLATDESPVIAQKLEHIDANHGPFTLAEVLALRKTISEPTEILPNLPITDAPWRANSVLLVRRNGGNYITIVEIRAGTEGNPIWNFWRFRGREKSLDNYLAKYRKEKEQRLQSGGAANPSHSSPSLETSGKPESRLSGGQTEALSSEIDNTAVADKVKSTPEPAAESSEKRAKFDAAPKAEVTGEEIYLSNEKLSSLSEIRNKVIKWLSERGWLKNYSNRDTGWNDISVSKSSVRSIAAHGAQRGKVQVVAALPDIIQNGIYLESTKIGAASELKRHIFAAKVDIAGEPHAVGFVVQEDAQGRKYYDHEMTEIENLGPPSVSAERKQTRASRDSVMNIVRKHLGVNPDMTQSGGNRGPAPIAEKKAPDKRHGEQTRPGAIPAEPKPRPPGPVELDIYLDRSNSPEKTPK